MLRWYWILKCFQLFNGTHNNNNNNWTSRTSYIIFVTTQRDAAAWRTGESFASSTKRHGSKYEWVMREELRTSGRCDIPFTRREGVASPLNPTTFHPPRKGVLSQLSARHLYGSVTCNFAAQPENFRCCLNVLEWFVV